MTILVTAANGDIGEAIGRILKERLSETQIHGADIAGAWPARDTFDAVHSLPRGSDATYPTALAALARLIGAHTVIPVSEPELQTLAEESAPIGNMPLVMAPRPLVRCFLNKLDTARWLMAHDLPSPRTVPLTEAAPSDLPLIVKSVRGYGARGYEIVRTAERLKVVKEEMPSGNVAQALLEPADQEYTCAVVRLLGEVRTLVMHRALDGSNTIRIEVVDRPDVDKVLEHLAVAADLEGSINVQLRITPAGPFIFEINPRFSGTVMMRHRLGFEDVVWSLAARDGKRPPVYKAPIGARVFRMSREVVAPPAERTGRNFGQSAGSSS